MKLRAKLMFHSVFTIIIATLLIGFILIKMLEMQASDKDNVSALVAVQKLEASIALTRQALSHYSSNATYGSEIEVKKQLERSTQVLGQLKSALERLIVSQQISPPADGDIQTVLASIERKWSQLHSSSLVALATRDSMEANRQSIRTLGFLNDLYFLQKRVNELYENHNSTLESEIRLIIWLCSFGVILLVWRAYVSNERLTQHITKPLKTLALQAQAVAGGGLAKVEEHPAKDEIGDLSRAFSKMVCQLEDVIYFDPLTRLPNRLMFRNRLELELAGAKRNQEKFALLYVDLDRFKNVNDSLGHAAGDLLLQAFAERVTPLLGDSGTAFRLGGDEFMILVSNVRSTQELGRLCGQLTKTLSLPYRVEGRELYVTASMGISLYPIDSEDGETLIKFADMAMYRAKKLGSNKYQFYLPEMNEVVLEKLEMESKLRRALELGELELWYQPQIDLHNGRIHGVEALIRWNHPELGLVSPTRFIPLAEETGLIVPIGCLVLREACRQNKIWQQLGLPHIRVSVNLSVLQFQQQDLVETVRRTLKETELDAQYLELEITESVAMFNEASVIRTLDGLKRLGLYLSIDDFGTGYSSFSYIKKFPVDTLKIDQAFIRDITKSEDDAAIASAMVTLAHSLQMTVVAEGVEKEEQLRLCRSWQCDIAQGYLFSPALKAGEIASWLTKEQIEVARQ
ncbi:bifunctional diguanylate cyclase/phosphodiesterase [Paenibacillus hamazuiensis]|uniref:bifunctional diguanylate cyclase/phosphodiesterase n=1 Tax=Paenibacillus hamazuiensis TaxID=2936508 RepID=UPI00200E071E|nr:bifunctional diguanylate cyclase/phosphodiesterase [Paenibacillus hamazuiensis]